LSRPTSPRASARKCAYAADETNKWDKRGACRTEGQPGTVTEGREATTTKCQKKPKTGEKVKL